MTSHPVFCGWCGLRIISRAQASKSLVDGHWRYLCQGCSEARERAQVHVLKLDDPNRITSSTLIPETRENKIRMARAQALSLQRDERLPQWARDRCEYIAGILRTLELTPEGAK